MKKPGMKRGRYFTPGVVGLPRLAAQSSGVLAECKKIRRRERANPFLVASVHEELRTKVFRVRTIEADASIAIVGEADAMFSSAESRTWLQ
jgi:hypothetical protein